MRQDYAKLRDQALAGLKDLPGYSNGDARGRIFCFSRFSGHYGAATCKVRENSVQCSCVNVVW